MGFCRQHRSIEQLLQGPRHRRLRRHRTMALGRSDFPTGQLRPDGRLSRRHAGFVAGVVAQRGVGARAGHDARDGHRRADPYPPHSRFGRRRGSGIGFTGEPDPVNELALPIRRPFPREGSASSVSHPEDWQAGGQHEPPHPTSGSSGRLWSQARQTSGRRLATNDNACVARERHQQVACVAHATRHDHSSRPSAGGI